MKKIYTVLLLAFVLMGGNLAAQTIWDDFDNPENVVYTYFDGTLFDQNFTNPSTTGNNTSPICAKYVRNGGALYDVIVIDPAGSLSVDDIGPYVAGTKKMSVKVFSPGPGLTIQITLENSNVAGPTNYPTGRHSEYTVTTTATNAWETLEFNYVNRPDPSVSDTSVNRMVLLFEPNTNNSTIWLFDDLMGPEFVNPCAGVVMDPAIVEDHECQRNMVFTFSNGTRQSILNPMMAGINSSSEVGKFRKFPPPTNDGAFGGSLNNPFTTATYNKAMIQLFDPSAPQDFHVIFQDGSSQNIIDTIFTTSQSTAWQEFEMDLSSVANSVSFENIVFLLNPSTISEDTIYFDNFALGYDSIMTAIPVASLAGQLSVYPNPFAQQFELSASFQIKQVSLMDLSGKLVYENQAIQGKAASIHAGNLPAGVYILKIVGQDGQQLNRKLIKE